MATERRCHACTGPVREVWGGYGFIGSASHVYWWLVVTEAKPPVAIAANAWMCDACHIAGGIAPPLTPEEQAENARRWAEIEARRGDAPFWRGTLPSGRALTPNDLRGDPASPGAGRERTE